MVGGLGGSDQGCLGVGRPHALAAISSFSFSRSTCSQTLCGHCPLNHHQLSIIRRDEASITQLKAATFITHLRSLHLHLKS